LGAVQWAQLNYTYASDPRELTPNDPQYGSQYHHPHMQNNLAWDTTLGDPRIVIGITDDGNDTEHQDLYLNIWVNQNEIPATRRTNLTDLNSDGYISMEELNDPSNQGPFKISDSNADGRISALDLRAAMIKDGSGNDTGAGGGPTRSIKAATVSSMTSTAAILADSRRRQRPAQRRRRHARHPRRRHRRGRTNNGVGIAGTAGRATVMPIKFYGSSGNTWTSTIISNAYHYGTDNGAKIISTSYNVDSFANDNIFRADAQLHVRPRRAALQLGGQQQPAQPGSAEVRPVAVRRRARIQPT
jgi:subtilisin family serine protease